MILKPDRPLRAQIEEWFRREIASGRLAPGERLPSTRDLATRLGVSRSTVVLAFESLQLEGYAEGRGPAGTVVARDLPDDSQIAGGQAERRPAAPSPPRLSARGRLIVRHGQVQSARTTSPRPEVPFDFRTDVSTHDETSQRHWLRIVARSARRSPTDWDADLRDFDRLRALTVRHLRLHRGVECGEEQVLFIRDPQAAMGAAAALLVDPSSPVVLEDPHYVGARNAYRAHGARLVRLPSDVGGARTMSFPAAAAGARLVHVSPSHQWPTGAVLPLSRRLALLEWVRRQRAYVLEDDYNGEFHYEGSAVPSLQGLDGGERVIYVGQFSRLFGREIGMAYVVAPRSLVEPMRSALRLSGCSASRLEARLLADFMEEGHMDRHLRRVRRRLAEPRRILLDSLRDGLDRYLRVRVPRSGFHVHAAFRSAHDGRTVDRIVRRAERAGIRLYPDTPFYLRRPRRTGLLFGFAWLPAERLREGVRQLEPVLHGLTR